MDKDSRVPKAGQIIGLGKNPSPPFPYNNWRLEQEDEMAFETKSTILPGFAAPE